MPKLIDYPRTAYTGAWEVAEVVDDTGGKCALETSARKLNRKVSGSFKAIVGSAVKFGLLTSKREMLTTTTLFRRIKHAYDKQEELLFHREAFLTPPLFTQLCRKFRSRELPVAMLDVLLMREFDVEEINAQSVAKAFTDGARMVGILNEDNILADIDQLAAQQPPRRELASPALAPNIFRQGPAPAIPAEEASPDTDDATDTAVRADDNLLLAANEDTAQEESAPPTTNRLRVANNTTPSGRASSLPPTRPAPAATADAIANLFGLGSESSKTTTEAATVSTEAANRPIKPPVAVSAPARPTVSALPAVANPTPTENSFTISLTGPGMQTQLEVADVDDLALVRALLDKIERRLRK